MASLFRFAIYCAYNPLYRREAFKKQSMHLGDTMNTLPDFELRQATMEDDADIRALIGSVSMPGAVSIRFSREPDYFLGTTIMG